MFDSKAGRALVASRRPAGTEKEREMKIRLLRNTVVDGTPAAMGDVVNATPKAGRYLIAIRKAELVANDKREIETATVEPPEDHKTEIETAIVEPPEMRPAGRAKRATNSTRMHE